MNMNPQMLAGADAPASLSASVARALGELNAKLDAIAADAARLPPPQPPAPPRTVADELEAGGFLRSVAGPDFARVVAAGEALESGKCRALLFTGCAGCGKTLAATILAKRLFRSAPEGCDHLAPMTVRCYALRDLSSTQLECFRLARCGDVLLDDAGGDSPITEYGTVTDYVAEFLSAFSDSKRLLCIMTTNLDSAGLKRRYGSRIMSRIDGNFGVLRFEGGDKRAKRRVSF